MVSTKFLKDTVQSASDFETWNTDLKKQYLMGNIQTISNIMLKCDHCKGTFWTWYPFYALWPNFEGDLPVISEQLRYNEELKNLLATHSSEIWTCFSESQCKNLPDLKTRCRNCNKIIDWLKPRKVINRLPDIDMWAVRNDDMLDQDKKMLREKFEEKNMYPSDINPIQTMKDIQEIVWNLKQSKYPDTFLPLDIHMIGCDTLKILIEKVPEVLQEFMDKKTKSPYLSISPLSLRKERQHDDQPYNFILDFLLSFTPQNLNDALLSSLVQVRKDVAKVLDTTEKRLYLLQSVCSDATKRRLETWGLKDLYLQRIKTWEK